MLAWKDPEASQGEDIPMDFAGTFNVLACGSDARRREAAATPAAPAAP